MSSMIILPQFGKTTHASTLDSNKVSTLEPWVVMNLLLFALKVDNMMDKISFSRMG